MKIINTSKIDEYTLEITKEAPVTEQATTTYDRTFIENQIKAGY